MKVYEEPKMELIDWTREDVITLSVGEGDGETSEAGEHFASESDWPGGGG